MNISYRWLRELAPSIADTPRELADRLSLLGAPADEIVPLGEGIRDVVIAKVTEVRPHPNADRLRICAVDAGGNAALQVVCGAPNVEAGGWYPFAPVGATLPGGVQIRKAKLRGETSEGMLCSARELGLGRDHAGLLALRGGDWDPGASFVDSLALDDARLLLDITPNRPELLSHWGVAREAAPAGEADLRLPDFPGAPAVTLELRSGAAEGEAGGVRVRIEDSAGCPRYAAAVVRGVRVGPSPAWLATRLRAAGLRPINNVVDATNYVLMELGQPLHAFDLARLRGGEIRVRRARAGEALRTLDGEDRPLDQADLVIADAKGPVALAGVMGGEDSEVREDTTDVLIECALFDPASVRRTRTRLGLSTDASFRFERGVDPEGQPLALRRTVELIAALAGGRAERAAADVNPVPFARRRIRLRPERVERVLGTELPPEEIAALLRPIGFEVDALEGPSGPSIRVTVPGFRPDVVAEIDLVEELARRRGYDSFPEELLPFRPSAVPDAPGVAVHARAREWLVRRGFLEARTIAFAPAAADRVPLLTPLSAEESHLRDALVPGLLRRVEHNWAHGVRDVRLFEVGTVFAPAAEGGAPREEFRMAAALTGARRPPHWTGGAPASDVWELRGLLEELAELFPGWQVTVAPPEQFVSPLLAPGDALLLRADGAAVGYGGRVAAGATDAPAWAEPVFVLEATLPGSMPAAERRYAAIPVYPASERDLALLVPHAVAAGRVEEAIRSAAGPLLGSVRPFDLYEGPGVPEGTRSIAFRLQFRAPDHTLTDGEVDSAAARVLEALAEGLGVRRR